MAKKNPTDREPHDPASPDPKDRKAERTVLALLIHCHPDRLTIPELSRTMNAGLANFDAEDAVERGVRELVGAGLLHCCGGFVLPTRAALYFERLEAD